MTETWEIRKSGHAVLSSSVKNCGYDEKTLHSLKQAGFSLYHNGKCVMRSGRTSR